MRVFFSHSQTDRPLAAELRGQLQAQGVTIKDVDDVPPAPGARQRIDDAIRSSDAVLLLINSGAPYDRTQDVAWQEAVGAAWDNPKLHLLPVLLGDSKLPGFVRSAAAGDEVQAVRIKDPRDVEGVSLMILKLLQPNGSRVTRSDDDLPPPAKQGPKTPDEYADPFDRSFEPPPDDYGCGGYGNPRGVSFEPPPSAEVETYQSVTEEDLASRRQWLDELREYAEKLDT